MKGDTGLEDRHSVWNLADPGQPVRVGEVRLVAGNRGLSFVYDSNRIANGYPLSGDMPLMANAGHQEMIVGSDGSKGTLPNALSQCERFDLERDEAIEVWFAVADCVAQWKEVFSKIGVTASDIEYLSDFIDSDDRVAMRSRDSIDSLLAGN